MISFIAAIGKGGVLGDGKKMPWYLPADFAHFKAVTMGKPVIMGRATHDSIGRSLPGRRNIVISRNTEYVPYEGAELVHAPEEALALVQNEPEVFVLGGGEIYRALLPQADRLYVTHVAGEFEGSVFFPEIGEEWQVVSREPRARDEKNAYDMEFVVYERQK